MIDVISQFEQCPILVVGDVMLDEFIWGHVTRISPEAPVPVVEVRRRSHTLGGAGNTAANVRSLGGMVQLAGVIGADSSGALVREVLTQQQIRHTALVQSSSRPTTTKTRVVAGSQQMVRIDEEILGDIASEEADELLNRTRELLHRVKACIVSDYGKGCLTSEVVQELIMSARSLRTPLIVDPKGRDYAKYCGATLIKPNQLEAGQVLNRVLSTDDDVAAAGADLLKLLGPQTSVLITRGAAGMSLFVPGQPMRTVPTQAREVFDVTGAGDTVAGALALVLAVGGTLLEACRVASHAAAVVVGKIGTATCSLAELRQATQAAGSSPAL